MLTEVHRQAQDNPIIRLSMDVREGRELTRGDYGEAQVIGERRRSIRSGCSTPTRCWSAATTRGAPTTCGCAS